MVVVNTVLTTYISVRTTLVKETVGVEFHSSVPLNRARTPLCPSMCPDERAKKRGKGKQKWKNWAGGGLKSCGQSSTAK